MIESIFPLKYAELMRDDAAKWRLARPTGDVRWDALRRMDAENLDASESFFFARQLEHIRAGLFEVQYPGLKGMMLVPVETNVNPGATEYTYRSTNYKGEAHVSSSMDSRPPSVEVEASESTTRIYSVTESYRYNIQEARSAAMTGMPLQAAKAKGARDLIARKMDEIILVGTGAGPLSAVGLFTQAGTETYTVPNGATGSPTFASKTPQEIADDLNAIANQIVTNSLGVEEPDTIVLPLAQYTLIHSRRMGDSANFTIAQHVLQNSPFIKRFEWSTYLTSNAAWSGARMVCYKKSPDKLQAIVPVVFEQFAPQARDFDLVTACHGRTAGTVVYAPKSIAYGDGI